MLYQFAFDNLLDSCLEPPFRIRDTYRKLYIALQERDENSIVERDPNKFTISKMKKLSDNRSRKGRTKKLISFLMFWSAK